MKYIKGNMFQPNTYNAKLIPSTICISTNGYLRADGTCVMGKGCAAQLKKYIPNAEKVLGEAISQKGNTINFIGNIKYGENNIQVVSFPVKPKNVISSKTLDNVVSHMRDTFKPLTLVPGWAAVADINLIRQSATELVSLTNLCEWESVVLPKVGAGAGQLDWKNISTILNPILDDRFYIIDFN